MYVRRSSSAHVTKPHNKDMVEGKIFHIFINIYPFKFTSAMVNLTVSRSRAFDKYTSYVTDERAVNFATTHYSCVKRNTVTPIE